MLHCVDIHVFTDNKNLMFDTLKCNVYYAGVNKFYEFSPIQHYIEGPSNILANNLSRLHRLVTPA
jgi:hypothetical protein